MLLCMIHYSNLASVALILGQGLKKIVIFDGDQGQWVGCLVTQYYIRCCLASLAGASAVDDVPPDSYVLRSMSRRPRS
uniref:Uncharacterized protein n=1 Tax=Brassica oleracea var. oleracea TaxID=109376 RepID=A0A0D3DRE3_BRAOL